MNIPFPYRSDRPVSRECLCKVRSEADQVPDSPEGTVNLIGSGRDKAGEGRSHEHLCPSGNAGDLGPSLEGLGSGGAILAGGAVIAAEVEEIVDPVMGGEEALGLAS